MSNFAHPPDNDNLLKTLEIFSDAFPKEVCIFDKIIQNRIVQNGQLRRNDKKTTGREGIEGHQNLKIDCLCCRFARNG